jgi:hypothetical protein
VCEDSRRYLLVEFRQDLYQKEMHASTTETESVTMETKHRHASDYGNSVITRIMGFSPPYRIQAIGYRRGSAC